MVFGQRLDAERVCSLKDVVVFRAGFESDSTRAPIGTISQQMKIFNRKITEGFRYNAFIDFALIRQLDHGFQFEQPALKKTAGSQAVASSSEIGWPSCPSSWAIRLASSSSLTSCSRMPKLST